MLDRVHRFGGGSRSWPRRSGRRRRRGVDALEAARGDHLAAGRRRRGRGRSGDRRARRGQGGVARAGRAVMTAARAGDARRRTAGARRRSGCCARTGAARTASSVWTARSRRGSRDGGRRISTSSERDYVGRPLLVTENDYELGLYNGDTGVIVRTPGRSTRAPCSSAAASCSSFSPLRLGAVETVYAMTIHKSQGSQFDTAAVLLPPPDSPILTRELLYTAVTRARRAPDPRRDRGDDPRRGRAAGGAGLGPARAAVGVTRWLVSRQRSGRRESRTRSRARARAASPPRRSGRRG